MCCWSLPISSCSSDPRRLTCDFVPDLCGSKLVILNMEILLVLFLTASLSVASGHMGGHAPQQVYSGQARMHSQVPQGQQPNLIRDKTHIQDREHIKEHLQGVVNQPDVSKMSEEELQFHYFKMHDNDDNNKLDGCELIKSVLHWHVEESKMMGTKAPTEGTTKIFTDSELSLMIDPILDMDDTNRDGFIDYPEFVAAQKSRGF